MNVCHVLEEQRREKEVRSPTMHFSAWGLREQETQDWASLLGSGMDAAFVFFFPEAAIFISIVLDRGAPLCVCVCVCVCAVLSLARARWTRSSNENNMLTKG